MQKTNFARLIAACILFFPMTSLANTGNHFICSEPLYNCHRWSLMYYYGKTVSDGFFRIVRFQIHKTPEQIQSLELAYTLDQTNRLRECLHPIVPVVQMAGNVTYRYGNRQRNIYEFDPYLIFRWVDFIWNPWVNTSLAIGEGASYATAIPKVESNNKKAKRFLNYLMFEATFASPNYPRLQLVARLHHRSGAFGLYGAGRKDGTNVLGLGVRYLFG